MNTRLNLHAIRWRFSQSDFFKTDGCCEAPAAFALSELTSSSVQLSWASLFAAEGYHVLLREKEIGEWINFNTDATAIGIINLSPCTEYEAFVEPLCGNDTLPATPVLSFLTFGCGPCTDLTYCKPDDINTESEWIEELSLNDFVNASGNNEGYGDFSGIPVTQLERSKIYEFVIKPGFASNLIDEDYKILD